MKLCVDCKYAKKEWEDDDWQSSYPVTLCTKSIKWSNPVDGAKYYNRASYARAREQICGDSAKNYEPRQKSLIDRLLIRLMPLPEPPKEVDRE